MTDKRIGLISEVTAVRRRDGNVMVSVKEEDRYRLRRVLLIDTADPSPRPGEAYVETGLSGVGVAASLLSGILCFLAFYLASFELAVVAGGAAAGLVGLSLAYLTRPTVIRATRAERREILSLAPVLNLHLDLDHSPSRASRVCESLLVGDTDAAIEELHYSVVEVAGTITGATRSAPAIAAPQEALPSRSSNRLYESRPGDPGPGARNEAADALIRAAELLEYPHRSKSAMLLELVEYVPRMPMVDQDHIERAARAITSANSMLHEVPAGLRDIVRGGQESPRVLAHGVEEAALHYLDLVRDAAARSAIDDLRKLRVYARQWEQSSDLLLEMVDDTTMEHR